uniref:Rho-related GTP-binding protein RhoU-like n=1 Tax=Pogona vitticeps TaxID=103695 RepID=A0A6J0T6V6_9SAUR
MRCHDPDLGKVTCGGDGGGGEGRTAKERSRRLLFQRRCTAPPLQPRGRSLPGRGRGQAVEVRSPVGPSVGPPASLPVGEPASEHRRSGSSAPRRGSPMPPQEDAPPGGFAALPPVPPHRPRPGRGLLGQETLRSLECVLLGDGAVGKTSLALSYSTNGFPARYVPTALDRFSAIVQVDDTPIRLQLSDTAGQDEFDTLRRVCYPKADVILLCFSVVAPTSFQNVADKWYPEVRRHCPATPVLLVGTQSDLRQDVKVLIALSRHREKPVPSAAARSLSLKLGMVGYLECSALTQHNLKEVFDTAIAAGLWHAEHPGTKVRRRSPISCFRTLSKAWWKKCICVR